METQFDTAYIAERAIVEHAAIQKPAELAQLLEMLLERKARTILEIGSGFGGTLWAWQAIGLRTWAIDQPDGRFGGRPGGPVTHGATVELGDSRNPDVRERIRKSIDVDLDALFIDANHTYDYVKYDFEDFSPWVRPGGLIVFHDICDHRWQPQVGVRRFWLELGMRADGLYRYSRELISKPETWGGIGVLEMEAA